MTIAAFSYQDGAPPGYVCATCGEFRCRLWRESNTFLDYIRLRCVSCAETGEKSVLPRRGDQIGGLLPAIPTEDGASFWGYTSVPEDGVEWWYRLPIGPTSREML